MCYPYLIQNDCIEKDIYRTKGSSTAKQKSFPVHWGLWKENFD